MKIAVLSGKGGAGKTFVSVNLAAVAKEAHYVDCDVEEPNGHLFLKPQNIQETTVYQTIPTVDGKKCNGCRKCVDFCAFHALVYLKKEPKIFPEVCHNCGGCALVCDQGAIVETKRPVGVVKQGKAGNVWVTTGVLNLGEASAIPVIKETMRLGTNEAGLTVMDCPPGSACSVMESVMDADLCVLVAEPTTFGLHNVQMVHELVTLLGKPCVMVINKETTPYAPLEHFCQTNDLPIAMRIPYSKEMAKCTAEGMLATAQNVKVKADFETLLSRIKAEVSA